MIDFMFREKHRLRPSVFFETRSAACCDVCCHYHVPWCRTFRPALAAIVVLLRNSLGLLDRRYTVLDNSIILVVVGRAVLDRIAERLPVLVGGKLKNALDPVVRARCGRRLVILGIGIIPPYQLVCFLLSHCAQVV